MNSYLAHFFGPQADYYMRATEELQEGKVQFNGAAFLAGILWMGYRKMYLQAFITAAIILSESVAEHYLFPGRSQTDNSSAIVALLMNAIIGFISNQMYVNFATRQVNRILTQHVGESEPQLLDAISRRGGTAWYGPFVVLLITVVAAVLILAVAEGLGVRME